MSDQESVVAVAYWRDPDGNQQSRELSYGEMFEMNGDMIEYAVFEVKDWEEQEP
jgi:hypothetical protein